MGNGMKALAMAVAMAGMAMQAGAQQAQNTEAEKRLIVISLEDRKLALIEDGEVKKIYTVAVGKPSTPSPAGTFTIERRVANPVYHHKGRTVAPGSHNPVGTRWMGLSVAGYGIHGTNEPNSIGKAASHGCIRMAKPDLEELYARVKVGDRVELIGQRNQETARLFAAPLEPAVPATATIVEPLLTALLAEESPAPAAGSAKTEPAPVAAISAALR